MFLIRAAGAESEAGVAWRGEGEEDEKRTRKKKMVLLMARHAQGKRQREGAAQRVGKGQVSHVECDGEGKGDAAAATLSPLVLGTRHGCDRTGQKAKGDFDHEQCGCTVAGAATTDLADGHSLWTFTLTHPSDLGDGRYGCGLVGARRVDSVMGWRLIEGLGGPIGERVPRD